MLTMAMTAADADDDAEHGQRRAQLVAPQRPQRGAHGHAQELHAGAPAPAPAARRADVHTSETICPSRKVMTRSAYAAMSGSCVTSTTVMPLLAVQAAEDVA